MIAKATPTVMAAGKAGGTAIVIRFKDLSIKVEVSVFWLIKTGRVQTNPITPIRAIALTK